MSPRNAASAPHLVPLAVTASISSVAIDSWDDRDRHPRTLPELDWLLGPSEYGPAVSLIDCPRRRQIETTVYRSSPAPPSGANRRESGVRRAVAVFAHNTRRRSRPPNERLCVQPPLALPELHDAPNPRTSNPSLAARLNGACDSWRIVDAPGVQPDPPQVVGRGSLAAALAIWNHPRATNQRDFRADEPLFRIINRPCQGTGAHAFHQIVEPAACRAVKVAAS